MLATSWSTLDVLFGLLVILVAAGTAVFLIIGFLDQKDKLHKP